MVTFVGQPRVRQEAVDVEVNSQWTTSVRILFLRRRVYSGPYRIVVEDECILIGGR